MGLEHVDGIISNDNRFMRKAYEVLFPNKIYLSGNEFINLVN